MNKLLISGNFKKVSHTQGNSLIMKVGSRRDYKNKTTGKREYDNITCYIPKFSQTLIDFVEKFVKDGDIVEVEAHIQTYTTEKNGQTIYHQDVIVDVLRVISSAKPNEDKGNNAESVDNEPIDVGNQDFPDWY